MHSAFVVTTTGVPLGLASTKFWTRKKFKGAHALKKKINPTRTPIEQQESYRWVEGIQCHAVERNGQPSSLPKTLQGALLLIAKLAGYLARAHHPPPGNLILWRGLARPTDIQIGSLIAQEIVGR